MSDKHKHSLQETKNTEPLTGLSARVVLAQEIANGLMAQNMLDVPIFEAMNVIAKVLESSPEYNNRVKRLLLDSVVKFDAQKVCGEYWNKDGGIKTMNQSAAEALTNLRESLRNASLADLRGKREEHQERQP